MKQSSRREFLLRIVASSAEAILFYIGYMFINQIFGGSRGNILFFVIVALCGLLVNQLPYNSSDKRKQSMLYSIIGLVLAGLATASFVIGDFNLFSMPIAFAASILLYYRTNTSYLSNVLYIYTIGDFNKNIGLLFIINALAAYLAGIYAPISKELMRYAVLYIVMGLYMLTEIKNFRYISKSENNKKSSFDILATGFIIASTIIMSIPKVFAVAIKPFSIVFGFVYGLMTKLLILITIPFGMLLNAFFNMIHLSEQYEDYEKLFKETDPSSKQYDKALINHTDPNVVNLIQMIGKALAFLLLLAICAYLLYVLFRFIDRLNRSKTGEDFEEDKEFVRGSRNPKGPGLIKRLGETVKKAAGEIAFMLTANNADKLRYEYKDFIKKLYNKKLITHYNYTALDIFEITLHRVPSQKAVLESITNMYEEVRYGVKYPQDNELKAFRKDLTEISKAILQSQ